MEIIENEDPGNKPDPHQGEDFFKQNSGVNIFLIPYQNVEVGQRRQGDQNGKQCFYGKKMRPQGQGNDNGAEAGKGQSKVGDRGHHGQYGKVNVHGP